MGVWKGIRDLVKSRLELGITSREDQSSFPNAAKPRMSWFHTRHAAPVAARPGAVPVLIHSFTHSHTPHSLSTLTRSLYTLTLTSRTHISYTSRTPFFSFIPSEDLHRPWPQAQERGHCLAIKESIVACASFVA